jgi:thioredoxin 1
MAIVITDSSFDELLNAGQPLVVDFWAEWCGPCKMIAPVVEELADEYSGKVNIGKMDVDENNEISSRYGIRNIPTILFFKNGQLIDKQVGATQKSALAQKIEALLKN